MNSIKYGGLLLIIGGLEFTISMWISENLYPGYNIQNNYISDLGIGSTAIIFNTAIIILGILTILSSILLVSLGKSVIFLFLTGIGALGVGIFPEIFGFVHSIFALIVFLFGGLTGIVMFNKIKSRLSYVSLLLGLITIIALELFINKVYLGLGRGGMERLIVYPELLWSIIFGIYFFTKTSK
ncbi:MAG: DUF998 domain-containing protein [Thermoprotei archaeon]